MNSVNQTLLIIFIIVIVCVIASILWTIFRSTKENPQPIVNPTTKDENLPTPSNLKKATDGTLGFVVSEPSLSTDTKYKTEIVGNASSFTVLGSSNNKYPQTVSFLKTKGGVYSAQVGRVDDRFVFSSDYSTAYKTIILFLNNSQTFKLCLNGECNTTQTVIKCNTSDHVIVDNMGTDPIYYLQYTGQN